MTAIIDTASGQSAVICFNLLEIAYFYERRITMGFDDWGQKLYTVVGLRSGKEFIVNYSVSGLEQEIWSAERFSSNPENFQLKMDE
jgi:hypothetical protein